MASQKFSLRAVPADQLLVLEKELAASPDELYEAFTSAELLPLWFAPRGWHIDPASVDISARIGGQQRFTMVNDKNPEMKSQVNAKFTVLRRGARVEGREEIPGPDGGESSFMGMRAEFTPVSDTVTRLSFTQGPMPEDMQKMAAVGWEQTLAKLQEVLASRRA